MTEIVFEAKAAPDGGYTARAIGYSIFTEADTLDGLREMALDAVRTHFSDDAPERPIAIRVQVLK
ncbi:MAG: 2-oxoisovalerate dehydrogenase [Chloroflexi bacterium]|nr:2-oxoisovalerate dehydrogenase [Chloroflexota bacterium]MYE31186.1 2-oxoisovalerate dehydrogenase [Chloroflexota bacterium]